MLSVLVDTGPLVAALDKNDSRHAWAAGELRRLKNAVTVWPAITEATHLLARRSADGPVRLLQAIAKHGMEVAPMGADDLEPLSFLVSQYADLPMDLADAALLHAYHRDGYGAVMTTDLRDFSIYRVAGKPVRLITPRD